MPEVVPAGVLVYQIEAISDPDWQQGEAVTFVLESAASKLDQEDRVVQF